MLASEYSWSLDYILYNLLITDYFWLVRRIRLRKIEEYLESVEVNMIPQMNSDNAEKRISEIVEQRRQMLGIEKRPVEMDRETVEAFKRQLQKSKFIGTPKA